MEILHIEMEKYGRKTTIPDFMAELSTGMAGRELSKLAEEVCALAEERRGEITPEMWKEVAARRSDTPGLDKDATWENLILADSVIKRFQTVCKALRKIEVLRKQGLALTSSILLYGPPGTGKTQIARTLANESGLPCIFTGPSDFKAGWVGQSAPKVHELFERARQQAPCILFIDEADAIFPGGGAGMVDQFTPEIVNQTRTELDGAKKDDRFVFVLAAANNPERIDEPILSRFNERIEIPNPDPDQRRRLLKMMISKSQVDFDVDQVAAELAVLTNNYGGRDLASLVKNASQLSVQRALDADAAEHVVLTRGDLMAQIRNAPTGSSRAAAAPSDFNDRAPIA
jgi:SpoVK/Ycf46/Vps4 family AAA+-type ATPase